MNGALGMSAVLAGVASAGALSAQVEERTPEQISLSVLFLGSSENSPTSKVAQEERATRFHDFETFLARHFTHAESLDRDDFRPEDADGFDVVLLDWRQPDIDIRKMDELDSPLGPREKWNTPTVLLGSAGLLLAGPFELPGSWG